MQDSKISALSCCTDVQVEDNFEAYNYFVETENTNSLNFKVYSYGSEDQLNLARTNSKTPVNQVSIFIPILLTWKISFWFLVNILYWESCKNKAIILSFLVQQDLL